MADILKEEEIWIYALNRRKTRRNTRKRWTSVSQREVSEEINPANTLILDSQHPELGENNFLLFKPPSLWYFVMAAPANY